MQVQYTSASRSSSAIMVTLEGSGHTTRASGVTFDPILGITDLVGVAESTESFRGELTTCARLFLENPETPGLDSRTVKHQG